MTLTIPVKVTENHYDSFVVMQAIEHFPSVEKSVSLKDLALDLQDYIWKYGLPLAEDNEGYLQFMEEENAKACSQTIKECRALLRQADPASLPSIIYLDVLLDRKLVGGYFLRKIHEMDETALPAPLICSSLLEDIAAVIGRKGVLWLTEFYEDFESVSTDFGLSINRIVDVLTNIYFTPDANFPSRLEFKDIDPA